MAHQVRIGCYSAFWGDSPSASRQLVEADDAKLDYLVADYLAEVTMGLLARASRASKSKSPQEPSGYIKEFLTLVLEPLLSQILDKRIKVITNAGGLNPVGLKELIEQFAARKGLSERVKVAAVYGDDIADRKNELLNSGAFSAFDPLNGQGAGETMFGDQDNLLSLNAYIGAEGIGKALSSGANIIVTGRCVDSALVLGPLAYEFSWDFSRLDDQATLDRLASASLAGHILECGAQATGGNFTDWELSAGSPHGGWSNMGYPIATFEENGAFTISKPEHTGGLVTRNTVCEQMLYEVLDPENYILPDVIVDLSSVTLDQVDVNTVHVSGVRGKPPTEWLKCTAVQQNGYRTSVDLLVFGARAEFKAETLGQAILQRSLRIAEIELGGVEKPDLLAGIESKVIVIGADHSLPSSAAKTGSQEVVVRVAAKHKDKRVLDILGREVASFATSSAPGIGMFSSGRPKASPNFSASSVLIKRDAVLPKVCVGSTDPAIISIPFTTQGCRPAAPSRTATTVSSKPSVVQHELSRSEGTRVSLLDIAVGRSGDKGDSANIAIIARHPTFYPYLQAQLTPELVRSVFGHFLQNDSTVTRYEVPGVHALNFVVTKCLGGGGLDSLALDRQAKGYAQICLASIHLNIALDVIHRARL